MGDSAAGAKNNASSAGASRRVLRLRMPSRREAVSATVERILTAVDDVGFTDDQQANFAVAVAEALSNAAVHGNRLSPDRHVRITVTTAPGDRATVEVRDQGRGFDSSGVADPTEPSRLLRPGGRGLFLMQRLVDHLEYNRAGNCVRLIMCCTARP